MKFNLILSILMCNFVQHLIIKTIRHVWLCPVLHQKTKKDEMYMCRIKEIYLCSMGVMGASARRLVWTDAMNFNLVALPTDTVIFWKLVVIKLHPIDFLLKASLRLPPPTEWFRKILWEVGLWIDRFASLKKSFEAMSSNTTTPGKSSCPGVQNMLANFHAQTLKNVAGSCALNFDATDLPRQSFQG